MAQLAHLLLPLILLAPLASAEGLYSKTSPVLQVSASSYRNLIEKSNYTSIVEFYAPWCGHCKNLAPAYAKAAQSLEGYANVAAINCDADTNKAFCGQMGVQGFPTLKIVKPKKKGGKPTVEDYNGERTAKAIKEAVLDKMPNHVTKVTDDTVDNWIVTNIEKPKLVFFTEKAAVSPLVKSIAIDFLGAIDVAQVRSTETFATGRFMVEKFPSVSFMATGEHVPEPYSGEVMTKAAILDWLKNTNIVAPNPPATDGAPKKEKKEKKAKSEKKTNEKTETPVPEPSAATETVKEDSHAAESSTDPEVASESPETIKLPVDFPSDMPSLDSEDALQKNCLNPKSGTCVLAVLSSGGEIDKTAINSLSAISHKHAGRNSKLFPFYEVPMTNSAGQSLVSALGIEDSTVPMVILAVNAKRGWWTQYEGSETSKDALETWIDNIRFGDFVKGKLPAGVVKAVEGEAKKERKAKAASSEESPIKVEKVEVMEEHTIPHEEL